MGTAKPCPLCWANGLLAGGRVLAEGEIFYTYVFDNEDGSLKYALINTKQHHANMLTLPPMWGAEFGQMYARVLELLHDTAHNPYWNVGRVAGQVIPGHWHVRIEPRFEGQPSSGMGLGLLITKYNEVMGGESGA